MPRFVVRPDSIVRISGFSLALLRRFRGAKRGANDRRHRATPGRIQPLSLQPNGTSAHTGRRQAVSRKFLLSSRSRVRVAVGASTVHFNDSFRNHCHYDDVLLARQSLICDAALGDASAECPYQAKWGFPGLRRTGSPSVGAKRGAIRSRCSPLARQGNRSLSTCSGRLAAWFDHCARQAMVTDCGGQVVTDRLLYALLTLSLQAVARRAVRKHSELPVLVWACRRSTASAHDRCSPPWKPNTSRSTRCWLPSTRRSPTPTPAGSPMLAVSPVPPERWPARSPRTYPMRSRMACR
jgi:hypothetical protein